MQAPDPSETAGTTYCTRRFHDPKDYTLIFFWGWGVGGGMAVIVGWFAVHTCASHIKWYNHAPQLLCSFYLGASRRSDNPSVVDCGC
jgi:hypothetical protein